MKKMFFSLKKIIISCFVLYGYNYISCGFDMVLPINFINIIIVYFFGSFGLIGLVFFKYFCL